MDPSGHGWKEIFGWVSAALSFLLPPLAPLLMAANLGLGLADAAKTGNWMGFVGSTVGSFVGGAVFGSLGQQLSQGITTAMGPGILAGGLSGVLGGALSGAVEFGLAGFGSGFGGALGGGASFTDAFKAGGLSAAVSGGIGAGIQGSYLGGFQGTLHGNGIEQIAGAQGQAALQAGRPQDLAGIGARLEARIGGRRSLYLHGTDLKGAVGIARDGRLWNDSWVTKPYAVDPVTKRMGIQLNPSEFQRFATIEPPRGEYFALVVAPQSSAVPRGLSDGGAPQWQIYGYNKAIEVFPNLN